MPYPMLQLSSCHINPLQNGFCGVRAHLKGVSEPGLRSRVRSSNCAPFLATKSASFVATS
mgnify:CR=1 FL=1